jgi:hypothetical protein
MSFMAWFTRIASTEMVHRNLHANADAERLARTELEYAAAERAWTAAFHKLKNYIYAHRDREPFALGDKIFMPLNRRDQERSLLVHEEFTTRTKRNELLAQRAELRKILGLSR